MARGRAFSFAPPFGKGVGGIQSWPFVASSLESPLSPLLQRGEALPGG